MTKPEFYPRLGSFDLEFRRSSQMIFVGFLETETIHPESVREFKGTSVAFLAFPLRKGRGLR
jgi:hypothetical protein